MNALVQAGKVLLATGSIIAITGFSLLYYFQDKLEYPRFFPPGSRDFVESPSRYNLPYEHVIINTSDHETLKGYIIRQQNEILRKRGITVIIFCGNGGNIGDRLSLAYQFFTLMGCNILMISYRGYGFSSGSPSEAGLKKDADAILAYALEEYSSSKIVLYGQSLGGAVALYLTSKYEEMIKGLILDNTFRSMPAVAKVPVIPFFCTEKWRSEDLITGIEDVPILFLSGKQDEIVPTSHMEYLYAHCRSSVRELVEFPDGTHNDTFCCPGYWEAVKAFLAKHVALDEK